MGTLTCGVLAMAGIFYSPLVYNLNWTTSFLTSLVSVFYAEPFLCVFLPINGTYFMMLCGLFFAQSGAVLANITTNEIENRHRLPYVVYPGRTVWSSSRSWVNFVDFFNLSKDRPQIDWANLYEFPMPQQDEHNHQRQAGGCNDCNDCHRDNMV